jgi:hypothetical protein
VKKQTVDRVRALLRKHKHERARALLLARLAANEPTTDDKKPSSQQKKTSKNI